jgi:hypothetical protein
VNQCRVYLQRARALGLVDTPAATENRAAENGRPVAPPAAVPVLSVAPEPAAAEPEPGAEVEPPYFPPPAEDRPDWLRNSAWPPWLEEGDVRWLCEEGSVSAYAYASQRHQTGQEEAREDLADMAELGLGRWNGVTFTVTAEGPPARNRGGRPRKPTR